VAHGHQLGADSGLSVGKNYVLLSLKGRRVHSHTESASMRRFSSARKAEKRRTGKFFSGPTAKRGDFRAFYGKLVYNYFAKWFFVAAIDWFL